MWIAKLLSANSQNTMIKFITCLVPWTVIMDIW